MAPLACIASWVLIAPLRVKADHCARRGARAHAAALLHTQSCTRVSGARSSRAFALTCTVVEGAKAVADQKKTISDQDLEALIGEKVTSATEIWELKDLIVSSSSKDSGKFVTSTATVTLHDHEANEEKITSAIGIGPVDAAFKAILKLVDRPVRLTNYVVTKIEGGSGPEHAGNDALASVVTHIKNTTVGDKSSLPADFPGHQGTTVREGASGNELGVVKSSSDGNVTCAHAARSTLTLPLALPTARSSPSADRVHSPLVLTTADILGLAPRPTLSSPLRDPTSPRSIA